MPMTMKHPRHTSPNCTSEKPETANQPKVHKILQGIRQPERVSRSFVFSTFRIDIMQFGTWGVRWGSSDYASRAKPGADGSREAQPIYDQQIAFSSSPTSEEPATASEPVEIQRGRWSRAQNRRSERCSVAKRAEPYRGTTLQKSQSISTALELGSRALSAPVSSPESYAGASGRKRHRPRKVSSSLSRRHADPTTSNGAAIPVYCRTWPGATSHSFDSNPMSFPQCCVAPPDGWFWPSNEAEGLANLQQRNFSPFGPAHATAAGGIAQTGHQISLDASYATSGGGTPMPGYSHTSSSDSIVWPWTYPVVTATRPALSPYNDDPEANQHF
ncbi:hypothetical protein F5887DRAFT_965767 [Amanita rubescens]|nr:hypothetical protein F5887DRAFT_965767 [Amanita rubescens]